MKVLFFGTPQFAAEVLKYLIENHIHIVGIIAKPDKPQGRSRKIEPVPVKQVAAYYRIPVHQPEKVSSEEFYSTLKAFDADLFVVVAYGEILKQAVLDLPKIACINLHASLLPKWRGAAPIQRAIMQGDIETGVSIMHMVKKMDAGNIIAQIQTPITPEMTYGELQALLLKSGSEALLKVIQQIEKGPVESFTQNEQEVTYAPKIELEDCRVEWQKPASELHNLIRGANPEPGAWCLFLMEEKVKKLKLYRSRPHSDADLLPGQIYADKQRFLVGCGKGALELLDVQLEGKKRTSGADFYRGIKQGTSINFI